MCSIISEAGNAYLSIAVIYNVSIAGADPEGGAPACEIVIFHTKYPKNVRASLRLAQFF